MRQDWVFWLDLIFERLLTGMMELQGKVLDCFKLTLWALIGIWIFF